MAMLNAGFDWSGKRVLVTGGDGFIGSHLAERLLREGARVSVFVRGNSATGTVSFDLKNTRHLRSRFDRILTGNIASADAVSLMKSVRPDVIFHLAADAYVPTSFERPFEVMQTNVVGTMNVLHAAMELGSVERIVCTSSSEIYGTALKPSIDETHPLNPTSPYAASKVAADRYCFSYGVTYNLPVAIIRPFNTYGPRHTYDVIPKFINLALTQQPLTVYGSGRQSRDFMYVDDTVEAFLSMGSHPKALLETVNFGTGIAVSVNRIAELVKELSGSRSEIVHVEKRVAEVECLVCDFTKARELFGWQPTVPIEEGLRRNIQWARENLRTRPSP